MDMRTHPVWSEKKCRGRMKYHIGKNDNIYEKAPGGLKNSTGKE
jgi:hypothetical protein